jgi:hypothetical protein
MMARKLAVAYVREPIKALKKIAMVRIEWLRNLLFNGDLN